MYKPTEKMAENAKRGIFNRERYGRGGTAIGAIRAHQLIRRDSLSESVVKRMYSFFSRHEHNRRKSTPMSNWEIAWDLWGGDEGYSWVKKHVTEMKKMKEEQK